MASPVNVSVLVLRLFVLGLCSPAIALANTVKSAGCGSAPGLPTGKHTFEYSGLQRKFRVHLPKEYDDSRPSKLILMFHGWGENEDAFLKNAYVRRIADEKNYIIIAPRGLSDKQVNNGEIWKTYNSWTFPGSSSGVGPSENGPKPICAKPSAIGTTNGYNYNSCEGQDGKNENKCAWTHCGSDDIGFVQALLTETKKELCVDEANVFAAGGSNGGMFTWGLGQNSATAPLFRAIAPLIGLPHRGYADGKGKAASLPVLLITGMRDKVVPPGNWNKIAPTKSNDKVGFMYESATNMTKLWSEQAGCDVSRRPRKVKRRIFPAGKGIQCRAWCSSGSDIPVPWVIDCRGGKMGHVYKLSQTFKMMVTFFDAHSAPASDESFS